MRCTILLKVVGNEKGGGREAGYCSKVVSDHGDRCLFTVNLPFPVCKVRLIGDWYENIFFVLPANRR